MLTQYYDYNLIFLGIEFSTYGHTAKKLSILIWIFHFININFHKKTSNTIWSTALIKQYNRVLYVLV